MNKDKDSEEELKRKREASSVSDTSMNEAQHNENSEKQKKKKAKQKSTDSKCGKNEPETKDDIDVALEMKRINTKLEKLGQSISTVNKTLENAIMKGDGSIRKEIRDLFTEIKDDLLKSVMHKVEIIEGHLFENDQAVDKLKTEIKTLKEELNSQKDINTTITVERKQIDLNRKKFENDSEQYSRANNIRVQGIHDSNPRESAKESAEKVIKILKDNDICNITMADIDIAHRLPNKTNTNREIIVRLVSRQTKGDILADRKKLKGTKIFINEDMTRLNLHVLMCVKKKMSDEVSDAWFSNGKIMFKSHMDKIQPVKFEEYEHWINLPWPSTTKK